MQLIGIGNDIIETLRIARLIERFDETFMRRVYTDREIAFCSSQRLATQHFACHWSAKEAALKAIGNPSGGGINWTDLEVIREAGRSKMNLSGTALERSQRLGIDEIQLSLSYCRTHATAMAVAVAWDDQ